mgnify:FL=1
MKDRAQLGALRRCSVRLGGLLGLLVVLLLAWPGSAAAGPEINIPRAEDGPGIKAGQRLKLP